jgi:iron complex outermembrane recepter protein
MSKAKNLTVFLAIIMPIWTNASSRAEGLSLEPMTVTAAKREADIMSSPLSISAFSADGLETSPAEGLQKFAELTPNLKFYSVGSRRTALLYMRGLGSSGPNMPAVGVFVDDVYYPKTGLSDSSLTGIERVEVLRGPQSTLYGRNTEGGAISLKTRQPGPERSGRVALATGDYDMYRGDLELSGPANAAGTLFYSLSGSYLQREGYTRNDLLDEDVDSLDRLAGRSKLRWLASDALELSFSIYADRDRDGGYALTTLDRLIAKPYHVQHSFSGSHEREMMIYDLQARYTSPSVELLSISAYRDWENRDRYDQDFSPADISAMYDKDRLQGFSQELRAASRGDRRLDWLGGVYFYHNDENSDEFTSYGADAGIYGATPGLRDNSLLGFTTWGVAPFARFDADLSERLTASTGLRFEHQRKEADGRQFYTMNGFAVAPARPFEAEQEYDEWMPEAALSLELSPELNSYVRIARGFREGGFNNGESGANAVFDPERAWSYEAGIKSAWLQQRLRVDLSVFQMDIENQQLIQFKPGGFGFSFKNAGESRNRGAELDLAARPLEWLELRGGFGLVDTEFRSFRDPVLGADYTGNRIPFVPDYNYYATLLVEQETVRDIVAKANIGVTGTGSTAWDEANTVETGAYTLLNAGIGISFGRYELSVFGSNLTDKVHPSAVYAFPNSSPTAQPGAPRRFGVMVSAAL